MTFRNHSKLWTHIVKEYPQGGVIGISGYGGAGKTELSKKLGRDKPGIQLVHVDDYLHWPELQTRSEDWSGIDFKSIISAHITPFKAGTKPVNYLIVEGIGLFTEARQRFFDFRVWVDTPLGQANGSGQARDKANQKIWEEVWVPNEIAFEKKHNPKQYVDTFYSWRAS